MNWHTIKSEKDLETLKAHSMDRPVMIFKHSTTCGISAMAKFNLENDWDPQHPEAPEPWLLDLLAYRHLSNKIAEEFKIIHQSPQALLIHEGQCVYYASHSGISFKSLIINTEITRKA